MTFEARKQEIFKLFSELKILGLNEIKDLAATWVGGTTKNKGYALCFDGGINKNKALDQLKNYYQKVNYTFSGEANPYNPSIYISDLNELISVLKKNQQQKSSTPTIERFDFSQPQVIYKNESKKYRDIRFTYSITEFTGEEPALTLILQAQPVKKEADVVRGYFTGSVYVNDSKERKENYIFDILEPAYEFIKSDLHKQAISNIELITENELSPQYDAGNTTNFKYFLEPNRGYLFVEDTGKSENSDLLNPKLNNEKRKIKITGGKNIGKTFNYLYQEGVIDLNHAQHLAQRFSSVQINLQNNNNNRPIANESTPLIKLTADHSNQSAQDEFEKFKGAYQRERNRACLVNFWGNTMHKRLKNGSITNMAQVNEYAKENPNSRTATIIAKFR